MAISEIRPEAKPKPYRRQARRSKWKFVVLTLFVGLTLAALVGLILLLNSNAFVQPR